jgi:hypothetical protein
MITSFEVRTDPYATYRQLRSTDPVHRRRLVDAWALTRYRNIAAVLRDHKRFGSKYSLLDIDPPEHTRLRIGGPSPEFPVCHPFAIRSKTNPHGRGNERYIGVSFSYYRRPQVGQGSKSGRAPTRLSLSNVGARPFNKALRGVRVGGRQSA